MRAVEICGFGPSDRHLAAKQKLCQRKGDRMNVVYPATFRRLRIGSVVLATLLTVGFAAQAFGQGMPAPSPNATLTIGIGVDLDTVDPAQQTTTTVQNVIDYGLQTLVAFDTQGKIKPLLATSWETSKDGLTLTFKLRQGVKFHDGTPFNAEAVAFSLDRLISGKVKVPIGAGFKSMQSIEAVNPTTVAIHLKHPDPNLLPNLSTTMASVFSPTSASKDGNSPTNIVHPVGTGPYQLTHWTKGSEVVYTRVDDYWGQKPYYKTVDFKIIPEANSREAGLLAGQLDVIMNPPVTDLQSLSQNSAV
ncbi:MAG TPA: ABC transporter substrate-binding protein, partial [Rhodanobacter sp.]|nr:ABC transporter substrate-binding protein [Rhodanobacter sp.]